jgi:hypothetical protein
MNNDDQLKLASMSKKNLSKEDSMKTYQRRPREFRKGFYMIILAACFLLFSAVFILQPFSAHAGDRYESPKSAEQVIQELKESLNLADKQEAAIQPIIEENVKQRNELLEKGRTDRRALRTELQKLQWSIDMKLGETLTEEQVEKYLKLKHERRENMHRDKPRDSRMHDAPNRSPEHVISHLREHLDLTEDQVAAIIPIIEESIENSREIFSKNMEERREAKRSMRNEVRTVAEKTEDQLAMILSDEQMKELQILKEEQRERMDRPEAFGF